MAVNSNAQLRHQLRKKSSQKNNTKPATCPQKIIDALIYIAVVMGPVMTLPQVIKIWAEKDASGVSFISWASFSFLSLIWIAYGIIHREKPIILMNLVLIITQTLIAVGAFIYS